MRTCIGLEQIGLRVTLDCCSTNLLRSFEYRLDAMIEILGNYFELINRIVQRC